MEVHHIETAKDINRKMKELELKLELEKDKSSDLTSRVLELEDENKKLTEVNNALIIKLSEADDDKQRSEHFDLENGVHSHDIETYDVTQNGEVNIDFHLEIDILRDSKQDI